MRRVWSRRGRSALAALGAAAGAALLATVLAAALTVSDRSLARGVAGLPGPERQVAAVWGGVPLQEPRGGFSGLDRVARKELTPVSDGHPPPSRSSARRGSTAPTSTSPPATTSRTGSSSSGRLPRTCTPSRCEVVQLAGGWAAPLHVRASRRRLAHLACAVRLPGRSETASAVIARAERWHRPAAPPFLLAEGVAEAAALRATRLRLSELSAGSSRWDGRRSSVERQRPRSEVSAARAALGTASPAFTVEAPEQNLQASSQPGRRTSAACSCSAARRRAPPRLHHPRGLGPRRDAEASRRRLTWLGASRAQIGAAVGAEATAITAAGAAVGWFAGIGPAVLVAELRLARRRRRRAFRPLRRWPRSRSRARSRRGSDPAGVGVGASRSTRSAPPDDARLRRDCRCRRRGGRIRAGRNRRGQPRGKSGTRSDPPPPSGLVVFIAAVVAARALGFLPRLLERAGRGGPLSVRLAALSLARNPGRAAIAVAFLVVSLGLALFAAVYRSTLTQGQRDQAAYAVPRRDRRRGHREARPRQPGGVRHVPALRPRSAGDPPGRERPGRRRLHTACAPRQVHGDHRRVALELLGGRGPSSRRIAPTAPVGLRSVPLPPGRLTLPLTANGLVRVRAAIETPDGGFQFVPVPGPQPGGRLLGLSFDLEDTAWSGRRSPAKARIRSGRSPSDCGRRAWTGSRSRSTSRHGRAPAYGRRRVPLGSPPLPRHVRPATPLPAQAAAGREGRARRRVTGDRCGSGPSSLLPVDVEGTPVLTRIVGTANRFPSIDGDFVVAERGTLATAMNADRPGTAVTNEIWLGRSPRWPRPSTSST